MQIYIPGITRLFRKAAKRRATRKAERAEWPRYPEVQEGVRKRRSRKKGGGESI